MSKLGKKRSSKLTPELSKTICNYLSLGMNAPSAAAMVGVHRNTMRYWLKRGRDEYDDDTSIYAQFVRDCNQAAATCLRRGLLMVNQEAAEDWRCAAWLLERRFPAQFAPKQMVVTQVQAGLEDMMEALKARLPPAVWDQVVSALQAEMTARGLSPIDAEGMVIEAGGVDG